MASPMAVTIAVDGLGLDAGDVSGISPGEKRKLDVVGSSGEGQKRDSKLRSKAWDHFTKLVKEDGTYEKSKCNHCQKLFSYSSRSGTTHLLRHITEGYCPVYNAARKDSDNTNTNPTSWKFDDVMLNHPNQEQFTLPDDLLQSGLVDLDGGYEGGAQPLRTVAERPKRNRRGGGGGSGGGGGGGLEESWTKELGTCVNKLVALTNERLPSRSRGKNCPADSGSQDYSISNAVRFLNEMEDIPASSEMYLDAFDLLRDDCERECFICLPAEARRRWLQRMLHRHHPLRYL